MMLPLKPLALSVYQQFWKLHIYKQIKSEIRENHLVDLKFSRNDFKNGKVNLKFIKDKEFLYNGIMFDIKSKSERKDSITYTVYRDIRESILVTAIHNSITHSGNFEQTLPNELLKLIKSINFDNFNLLNLTQNFSSKYISPIISYEHKFTDFIRQIIPPPPKMLNLLI